MAVVVAAVVAWSVRVPLRVVAAAAEVLVRGIRGRRRQKNARSPSLSRKVCARALRTDKHTETPTLKYMCVYAHPHRFIKERRPVRVQIDDD